jgi:hypothetical protein
MAAGGAAATIRPSTMIFAALGDLGSYNCANQ